MKDFKHEMRSENPFFEMHKLLALEQSTANMGISEGAVFRILDEAWKEAEQERHLRQMFYMLIFNAGQIPNRQNNMYGKKKVPQGGKGNREFWKHSLKWTALNDPKQYYIFLHEDLYRQHTGLSNLFENRVVTIKGSTEVKEVINTLSYQNPHELAKYHAKLMREGNSLEKNRIAMNLPRVTYKRTKYKKRTKTKDGYRPVSECVHKLMKEKEAYYIILSKELNFKVVTYDYNIYFKGLYKWKKKHGKKLESYLFSSGKIFKYSEQQFINWLDGIPADANKRVFNRLFKKDAHGKSLPRDKWVNKDGINLATWYTQWSDFKTGKQAEERKLKEKKRQGVITNSEEKKLEKVSREAKVNTGARNPIQEIEDLAKGRTSEKEANLIIHSLMNLFDVNIRPLVWVDISTSMNNPVEGTNLYASTIAPVIATLILLNTPDEEASTLMGTFGLEATMHSSTIHAIEAPNRFMHGKAIEIPKLIDRTKDFMFNLKNIQAITRATQQGTKLTKIPVVLKEWVDSAPSQAEKDMRKEAILSFPLFVIISDGHFNSERTGRDTLIEFMHLMDAYFGWKGGFLFVDLNVFGHIHLGKITYLKKDPLAFKDIKNVVHSHGWNVGELQAMLEALKDTDMLNIYTDLLALWRNDRYAKVKELTL